MGDLANRVQLLNKAFDTPFFKEQLKNWNLEKQANRNLLQEYWNKDSTEFISFWQSGGNESHLKEAIVLAVIEESTESLVGAFIDVVCPEIPNLKSISVQSIQQGDCTICPVAEKIIDIVKFVTNSTENERDKFNREEIEAIINDTKLEKGDFIIHSLLLVRSCVLLQFCISLWIMFNENPSKNI